MSKYVNLTTKNPKMSCKEIPWVLYYTGLPFMSMRLGISKCSLATVSRENRESDSMPAFNLAEDILFLERGRFLQFSCYRKTMEVIA